MLVGARAGLVVLLLRLRRLSLELSDVEVLAGQLAAGLCEPGLLQLVTVLRGYAAAT